MPIGEEPAGAEPMECDKELLRYLGQRAEVTRLRGANRGGQAPPLSHGYAHHGWLPGDSRSTRTYQATNHSCATAQKPLRGAPLDTD